MKLEKLKKIKTIFFNSALDGGVCFRIEYELLKE